MTSAFTLSACTSLVREPDSSASIALPPLPAPAAAQPAPDPAFDATTAAIVETAVAEVLAAEAAESTAATPRASQYRDIFARIRAGFQLDDPDQRTVDVQLNWYVNNPEYLERTFGRGELYLHYIVSQVEARNLPMELALLPVVESAYEPFGYSHARAAGLWQFIPGTGKRFGLKQNWWYDGRRDVVESTRAALDYLQFLNAEFNGDWLLAIAAYNCGEMNVVRAIARNRASGKPTDFWHLKLPKETRAYVPKLLAMRRLVSYPGDYGLEFTPIPNQPYFAAIDTGGQIDLVLASELAGITHDELSNLNPAFNRWATDPEGPHQLLLPADVSEGFTQALALVPLEERVRTTRVAVQSGESLTHFARRTGSSASVIRQINGLTKIQSNHLKAGQELLIPASNVLPAKVAMAAARVDRTGGPATRGRFHVVRRGESLWSIAQRHGLKVSTLAAWNGMQPGDTLRAGRKIALRGGSGSAKAAVPGEGSQSTYTVKRGDTLSQIARRFSVSVSQLLSWNGLSSSHRIMPGQRLVMFRPG